MYMCVCVCVHVLMSMRVTYAHVKGRCKCMHVCEKPRLEQRSIGGYRNNKAEGARIGSTARPVC